MSVEGQYWFDFSLAAPVILLGDRHKVQKQPPAITPLMVDVERILRRIANHGADLPSYVELGEMAGSRLRPSIARAITRLSAAGRFEYQVEPTRRRVVFPDGRATGWRHQVIGHAPYSTNQKGSAPDCPARSRRGDPVEVIRLAAAVYNPIDITPAGSCQWPLWGDDEKPTYRYCGAPTAGRRSWCEQHDPSGGRMRQRTVSGSESCHDKVALPRVPDSDPRGCAGAI